MRRQVKPGIGTPQSRTIKTAAATGLCLLSALLVITACVLPHRRGGAPDPSADGWVVRAPDSPAP